MIVQSCDSCIHNKVCAVKDIKAEFLNEIKGIYSKKRVYDFIITDIACKDYIKEKEVVR